MLFLCFKSDDKKLSPPWPLSSVRDNPPWPKHPLHVYVLPKRARTLSMQTAVGTGVTSPMGVSPTGRLSPSAPGCKLLPEHASHRCSPGLAPAPSLRTTPSTSKDCSWHSAREYRTPAPSTATSSQSEAKLSFQRGHSLNIR